MESEKNNQGDKPKGSITIGSIGLDILPNWILNFDKFPSLLKIMESEFFLAKLQQYHPTRPEFQFMLSGFLTSSRSIFWHLLEEYTRKYQVKLESYVNF